MTYRKDKLHKGTLVGWDTVPTADNMGLGYSIVGMLDGELIQTTAVIACGDVQPDGNTEIETRNSFYTLLGAEGVRAI